MKGKIARPLSRALKLKSPAVKKGTTVGDYLDLLTHRAEARVDTTPRKSSRASKKPDKSQVSIRLFARWLRSRSGDADPVDVNEELIEAFREDLKAGAIRGTSGKAKNKKYSSLDRQAPAQVVALHNTLVEAGEPIVYRELEDSRSLERYRFFLSLTRTTQKALTWFEESGTRAARNGGKRRQLMTAATRRMTVNAALGLLRNLKMTGLEQISPEKIEKWAPNTGNDDKKYRRKIRQLNALKGLYRSCVENGYLKLNPLESIAHNTFTAYGQRDFLPPEELDRIRDLSMLNIKDDKQVTDRLVLLLYADTCLRLEELASLDLTQVRKTKDGWQIDLLPDNQKMTGKSAITIPILYPETEKLLERYVTRIRKCSKYPAIRRLMINRYGRTASGQALSAAVKREGERLGLKTYFKQQPPSPHDLRRTFAMCNAAPLGLNMQPNELADRLRDGIAVVFQNYVKENPVISSKRAEKYRTKLNGKAESPAARDAAEILAKYGVRAELVKAVSEDIDRIEGPKDIPDATQDSGEWISEAEAEKILLEHWSMLPFRRRLRDYLRREGALRRVGEHGQLKYARDAVEKLVDKYIPAEDPRTKAIMPKAAVHQAVSRPEAIHLGRVRLILKDDFWRSLSPQSSVAGEVYSDVA